MNRWTRISVMFPFVMTVFCSGLALARQAPDIAKYCTMLHSLDDNERDLAVEELAKIGKPAVPSLIGALSGDEVYLGRAGAAVALGRIRDRRAVAPLVSALDDEYRFVREKASVALGQIGGPEVVDALMGALAGKSDNFLEAAATTLGLLKDKRALPALEKLSAHQNADVAGAAAEAIRQIKSRG
jgi:HEAT repeat protein